jgi:hypothetical protein
MSKFFNIDDWEPVDLASAAVGVAAGVNAPLLAGFSIFMSGEGSTPTTDVSQETGDRSAPGKPEAKPLIANIARNQVGPRDIMAPPKPNWAGAF